LHLLLASGAFAQTQDAPALPYSQSLFFGLTVSNGTGTVARPDTYLSGTELHTTAETYTLNVATGAHVIYDGTVRGQGATEPLPLISGDIQSVNGFYMIFEPAHSGATDFSDPGQAALQSTSAPNFHVSYNDDTVYGFQANGTSPTNNLLLPTTNTFHWGDIDVDAAGVQHTGYPNFGFNLVLTNVHDVLGPHTYKDETIALQFFTGTSVPLSTVPEPAFLQLGGFLLLGGIGGAGSLLRRRRSRNAR
jgi:hypothetical protein